MSRRSILPSAGESFVSFIPLFGGLAPLFAMFGGSIPFRLLRRYPPEQRWGQNTQGRLAVRETPRLRRHQSASTKATKGSRETARQVRSL
jgi:hypothetical protein